MRVLRLTLACLVAAPLVALTGGCAVRFAYRNVYTMDPEANDYYTRGVRHAYEGRLDEAIRSYTDSIKIRPSAAAFCNRSDAFYRKGRYEDAETDAGSAIRLLPSYGLAYFNRGNARFKQKNYDGALEDYTAALKLGPARAEYYFNSALAYERTGRPDEALTLYHRTVEADPRYAAAHYNLACMYAARKEAPRALESLEKAVDAGFTDIDKMKKDVALQNIRAEKGYLLLLKKLEEGRKSDQRK